VTKEFELVRKIVVAPLLALVLSIPVAGPALASGSDNAGRSGASRSERSHEVRHGKAKRIRFVELGTVATVNQADHSLTISVRRGLGQVSRGGSVTVGVTDGTAIRRNGLKADLDELVAGDRVLVEGKRNGNSYVAVRIRARAAKVADAPSPATPTVTPTPSTTPSVTPTPSATPAL
jgi:hypothetical protein